MTPRTPLVDVGSLLDEGRWSLYQKLLVFATALAVVLNGLDNQATSIRTTGVGGAVALGLFGGVLSTYVGWWALESGGASLLFALLAAAMTVVLVALASVRWHIPPGSAARRG